MKVGRESWLLVIVPAAVLIGAVLIWRHDGAGTGRDSALIFEGGGEALAAGPAPEHQEATGLDGSGSFPGEADVPTMCDPRSVASGALLRAGDHHTEPAVQPLASEWTRTIRDRSGVPIAGATVVVRVRRNVRLPDGSDVVDPECTQIEVVTDADGRISLKRLPGFTYTVEVRAAGYGMERFDVADDGGESLTLDLAAVVHGRLRRRSTGEFVSGARVTFTNDSESITVTTDDQGRFQFDGINARAARLSAMGVDFMALARALTGLRPGESTPVDIDVDTGAVLEGEVVDAGDQNPLANAAIMLVDRWTKTTVSIGVTDSLGRFRFSSLNPAHDYALVAMRGGYFGSGLSHLGVGLHKAHARIELTAAFTLAVKATDTNGDPLAGVQVVLARHDGLPLDGAESSRFAFTDQDGVATFPGLTRTVGYRVTMLKPGFGAVERSPIESNGADLVEVSAALVDSTPVSGRVVDDLGNPVPYATVRAIRADGTVAPPLFTLADAQGAFSFAYVAAGRATFVAYKGGFDNGRQTVDVKADDPPVVTLTVHNLNADDQNK